MNGEFDSKKNEVIKSVFEEHGIIQYSDDTLLREIIADSIKFLKLIVDFEGALDIEFGPEELDLGLYEKVSDLIEKLHQKTEDR